MSQNNANNKLVAALSAVALLIVGILVFVLLTGNDHPLVDVGGKDGELGGDFSLQSAEGKVSLSDYKGKVVVVYFGFLSCPEVCPTSMGVLKSSFNKLGEQSDNVQGILISIDPKRDTFDKLANFANYYHQNIIGVTGTPDEIDNVAREYGAYFKAIKSDELDKDYVFEHSSRYYIINQQGDLVDAMRHSTTPNELTAKIKSLL